VDRVQRLAVCAIELLVHVGASAQAEESRALKVTGDDGQTARPLGLRAALDRPEPVYAVGDPFGVVIATDYEALIEIWDIGPDGSLTRLLPDTHLSAGPGRPLRLPMQGQRFEIGDELGFSEFLVIARAAPTRAVARADARLPGSNARQEVRLRYRVVAR
jgi:hypothetical protein